MVGGVLDPVLSLRRVARLRPGGAQTFTSILAIAETRDAVLEFAGRFTERGAVAAAFRTAATRQRDLQRRLGVSARKADFYDALAAAMLHGDRGLRAPAEIIGCADGGLDALWPYGIGDGQIVVVRVEGRRGPALVTEALRANAYLRDKGIAAKLVFLCASAASASSVQSAIGERALGAPVDASVLRTISCRRRSATWSSRVRTFSPSRRRAEMPPTRRSAIETPLRREITPHRRSGAVHATAVAREAGGGGGADGSRGGSGFNEDGSEYVIQLRRDAAGMLERPPMPWCNVIANEHFGFLTSEGGPGLAWSRNSRENRLTPWYNDPIADPPGEAFYVRDEDAGVFWSPLPGPVPADADFEVRHGFGYTTWRHTSFDLEQTVTMLVALEPADPVKITRLELVNRSDRPRRLALFAFTRLVLGADARWQRALRRHRSTTPRPARCWRGIAPTSSFATASLFAAAVGPAAESGRISCTGDRSCLPRQRRARSRDPAALMLGTELDGQRRRGARSLRRAAGRRSTSRPDATVECASSSARRPTATRRASPRSTRIGRPAPSADALTRRARILGRSSLGAVHVETPVAGDRPAW